MRRTHRPPTEGDRRGRTPRRPMTIWQKLLLAGSLLLAAATGVFASIALSAGAAGPAVTTTTVNVGSGATGPRGPAGPAGAVGPTGPQGTEGGQTCPAGFVNGELVLNHAGGHVTVSACIKTAG